MRRVGSRLLVVAAQATLLAALTHCAIAADRSRPARAEFQRHHPCPATSGLAARHMYLIEVESGTSWQLATGKSKKDNGEEVEHHLFQPF